MPLDEAAEMMSSRSISHSVPAYAGGVDGSAGPSRLSGPGSEMMVPYTVPVYGPSDDRCRGTDI